MNTVLTIGKAVHAGYLPTSAPPFFFPCPPLKIQHLCSEDLIRECKKLLRWMSVPHGNTRQLVYFSMLHTFVKLFSFSSITTPKKTPTKKTNLLICSFFTNFLVCYNVNCFELYAFFFYIFVI